LDDLAIARSSREAKSCPDMWPTAIADSFGLSNGNAGAKGLESEIAVLEAR
jgi:hypothetical protein